MDIDEWSDGEMNKWREKRDGVMDRQKKGRIERWNKKKMA